VVLLPQPEAHIELWRRQLGLIVAQGNETMNGLERVAGAPGVLSDGQTRLRALARAVRDQVDDIVQAVGPSLGGALPPSTGGGLPRGVVEYIHYLYRDWGWESSAYRENEQAVDDIRQIASERAFGRTLVLGAGGCRLAYDLHRQLGATETAVIDIDPYLLIIAEAVIRGHSVQLTESAPNVFDAEHVATSWTLKAPNGPLDGEHFHFFFANGLAPPFVDGAFDTVVTPWFIDKVPTDLESFFLTLHRLLRPGGRWINQGPLLYPPETAPERRFSREEIFDVAGRAGFRVGRWSRESRPYLVSPHSGRGKVECVLTFEAFC